MRNWGRGESNHVQGPSAETWDRRERQSLSFQEPWRQETWTTEAENARKKHEECQSKASGPWL